MAWIRSHRTAKGARRYEVCYRDADGRERSRTFSVHKDARAFKLDVERRRQAGALYQATPERFGGVAQAWLERFVIGAAGRRRPRPKTIQAAEDSLRCLAPLADLPVERIRRAHVEDLLASIAAHAPRRAEMALSLLKRVLRAAEDRGQQVDRAIYGVRIAKAGEREPRFLTWEEAEELESWMPEDIRRIVPVTILTLLRRGEILGLRDGDIDFASGSIAVFSQRQDGEHVETKTHAGRRTVDVGPRALALLREQQLARSPIADGYLFTAPEGGPFDPDNFYSRTFKPAACHAGIPELTFQDLRHTGASLMIAAGCHVKVIAERMGHSDGGTLVLRRYGHLYKGAGRQAAMALESHIFEAPKDSAAGWMRDEAQI
jgi:integrase